MQIVSSSQGTKNLYHKVKLDICDTMLLLLQCIDYISIWRNFKINYNCIVVRRFLRFLNTLRNKNFDLLTPMLNKQQEQTIIIVFSGQSRSKIIYVFVYTSTDYYIRLTETCN